MPNPAPSVMPNAQQTEQRDITRAIAAGVTHLFTTNNSK